MIAANSDDDGTDADHCLVFTMGGTIDKDYPRLTSGYAFEFGEESAASRILSSHPNLAISHECVSLCKKDSLEIDADDRDTLVRAIRGAIEIAVEEHFSRMRIVVTHGTDTLIDTARHVKESLKKELSGGESNVAMVVAFVGATKPERFVDSDAAFNLGSAMGATSYLPAGSVVICMNGNVIDADECVRGKENGLFQRMK